MNLSPVFSLYGLNIASLHSKVWWTSLQEVNSSAEAICYAQWSWRKNIDKMKKIYLLALSLLLSLPLARAQGLGDAWWGVRAGVNFSNLSSIDYSTDYLTGFSVGVSYNHPISQSIPI